MAIPYYPQYSLLVTATNAGLFPVQVTSMPAVALTGSIISVSGLSSASVTISNASIAGTAGIPGTDVITVQGIAGMTPVQTTLSTSTNGGFLTYHLVSASTTNATVVKATSGKLYGWYLYNANTYSRKLTFHDSSSAPFAGTNTFFAFMVPGGSAANVLNDVGIQFSSGIAITTTTGIEDTNNSAVSTSDLSINLFYV